MLNTVLIILIVLAAIGGGAFWITKTAKISEREETKDPYALSTITEYINTVFNNEIKKDLTDLNVSREELKQMERFKRNLRNSIRMSSIGDMTAKNQVRESIKAVLNGTNFAFHLSEDTIDRVINFSEPKSSRDKFEIMLYGYENIVRDENGHLYGADGIKQMFKDYGFNKPAPGTYRYEVTEEQLNEAFSDFISKNNLDYRDKLNILAQRVFENLYGFGVVDMLLDTSIDEVQGGMSGVPKGSYEFKNTKAMDGASFSYDSIWIVMSGLTIHLKCLSFGSQSELIRVCNNIYKYDSPNVMSKVNGKVVATMKDGSRIVVVRPPFADSYAFLARKFDSAPSIAPEDLLKDKGHETIIIMLKWLIKSCRNIAITGDQGTGKTTMLKSLIRFIREDYTIRIQELTPELNLRYTYPDRNVLSFRETEHISSQEGLDLQKKTSGTVNIIGEVATAEAAAWIIQTAKVASKMTMFTHHAKNTKDLIVSIRNNIMQVQSFTNDASVDEMVADALNIDVHLERKKGKRFIGRVTEIIPIRDRSYPADELEQTTDGSIPKVTKDELDAMDQDYLKKADLINQDEYRKRMTDRVLFTWRDIIRFNEETEEYELINMPSDEMLRQMRETLSREEELQMNEDFSHLPKPKSEMYEEVENEHLDFRDNNKEENAHAEDEYRDVEDAETLEHNKEESTDDSVATDENTSENKDESDDGFDMSAFGVKDEDKTE